MAYIGQQFGNYRLIERIGTGGTAVVYRGERIDMPMMKVAIKILKTDIDDSAIKKSFLREVEIMARLNYHNHIISILDFGVEGTEPYIIMDLALGGNLAQIHSNHKPIAKETISSYVKQIADALYYAHSQHPQIVHCDLKPQNIFLDQNQHVLVGDFGYAHVHRSTQQHSATPEGATWQYTAPEQINSKRFGERSPATDQYGLGVMVYQWLSGSLPFMCDMPELLRQHLEETPPSLLKIRPDLPFKVEEVVFKALAKHPGDRFPDIQAFASALEAALQSSPPTLLPSPGRTSKHRKELSEEIQDNDHSMQHSPELVPAVQLASPILVGSKQTNVILQLASTALKTLTSRIRPVTGCAIGVIGITAALLITLGTFAGIGMFAPLSRILGTQAVSTFSNIAQTTQGTVQSSFQIISSSTCSTTVTFTLPGYKTSFTTIDRQCNALEKGTTVAVLYDPHNPSIAETARQNSEDVRQEQFTDLILGTLFAVIISGAVIYIAKWIGGWSWDQDSSYDD